MPSSGHSSAAKPRVHVFLATSDLHLKYKLRITRAEALDTIGKMVAFASERCPEVEFSAEDASRSDMDYLAQVLTAAVAAGATESSPVAEASASAPSTASRGRRPRSSSSR